MPHPASPPKGVNPWAATVLLLMGNFMNLIDVSIVNVALPSIRADLGASETQIEWISAAYVLAFAVGLLPCGRFGPMRRLGLAHCVRPSGANCGRPI